MSKKFAEIEPSSMPKLGAKDFYAPFHGHDSPHLQQIVDVFREDVQNKKGIIWLAGDSSLDNKYWFRDWSDAENGYEHILQPPKAKRDIAYWMNKLIAQEGAAAAVASSSSSSSESAGSYVTVNAAVEESTVGSRSCNRLLAQDRIIRDNITPGDVLVVSVGGNDIALAPNACTVVNMLCLLKCFTSSCIKQGCNIAALPCEECCCGCGFSCLNTCCGCPPSIGYFVHLFKIRIEAYVRSLTGIHRPKKILVCMIYYPDENPDGSWADATLSALGYNSNPAKLQLVIRKIFALATQEIKVSGTEVVAVPLFVSLDGKNSDDYVQRVEPSASGGEKMAKLILDAVKDDGRAKMDALFKVHAEDMNR